MDNDIKGHDHFFKQSMSRLHVAREFFETYLPDKVLELTDLNTLSQVNTSFIDSTLGEGIVDLLYSVKIQGTKGYFWILCEHQSTQDKMISFRIQKYMLRICSDHVKKHPGSKLPLIYPILIYSGKYKYTAPLLFWDLFEIPKLAKSFFTKEIQLLEVSKVPDELIKKKMFIGIMLYFFRHINAPDITPYIKKINKMISEISEKDFYYLIDVLHYILNKSESNNAEKAVLLIKKAVSVNKGTKIMTLAEQLIEKGKASGIREGIKKGKLEIASKMLDKGQSIELIAELTGLTIQDVERLRH